MTTSTLNGMPRASLPQRKSLNQQLDRLDRILDGLSDGLQAAVVDAVKDAVGLAVQVALREVLTHPEIAARLAPAPLPVAKLASEPAPAPAATGPSWTSRLAATVRSIAARLRNRCFDFVGETREAAKQSGRMVVRIARVFWTLIRSNVRAVALALFVGTVAGAACYVAGPIVAAAVSGLVTAILAGVARLLAPFAGMFLPSDAEA
jgi:hypothetical protein